MIRLFHFDCVRHQQSQNYRRYLPFLLQLAIDDVFVCRERFQNRLHRNDPSRLLCSEKCSRKFIKSFVYFFQCDIVCIQLVLFPNIVIVPSVLFKFLVDKMLTTFFDYGITHVGHWLQFDNIHYYYLINRFCLNYLKKENVATSFRHNFLSFDQSQPNAVANKQREEKK